MHSTHRTSRYALLAAVAVAATLLWTEAAAAQASGGSAGRKRTNERAKADTMAMSEAAQSVDALSLAGHLADYGRRSRSALALATAAQIMLDNPTRPADEQPQARAGTAKERAAAGGTGGDAKSVDS